MNKNIKKSFNNNNKKLYGNKLTKIIFFKEIFNSNNIFVNLIFILYTYYNQFKSRIENIYRKIEIN